MGSLSDDIYMKEPTRKEMEEFNHRKKLTPTKFKNALRLVIEEKVVEEVIKDLDILLEKEHEKGARKQLTELRRLSDQHILKLIKE